MKKAILSIAIAGIFAACNQAKPVEQTTSTVQVKTADTTGYAQFEQWKEKQELIDAQGVNQEEQSYTTETSNTSAAPKVIYRTIVKDRPVRVSKPIHHTERSVASTTRGAGTSGSGSTGSESNGGISRGSGSSSSNGDVVATEPTIKPAKKEGWSKAAKGTAIGAGSGAVIGAILSKDNKGKGAVIGGVVGAAGGYVLGRMQDKKDGRY